MRLANKNININKKIQTKMKHTEESNIYIADNGNFIIRISDHFIMGEDICLGSSDSIDNYSEEPYTKQSYLDFYVSCGIREEDAKERWNIKYPNDPWTEEEHESEEETLNNE